MGVFPGRRVGYRGWQVLLNIAKKRFLVDNPLAGKAGWKILAKSEFCKFTLMEKYKRMLFIERIWRGQKFDKPSYYHGKYEKL
jgi:hypothetical protein